MHTHRDFIARDVLRVHPGLANPVVLDGIAEELTQIMEVVADRYVFYPVLIRAPRDVIRNIALRDGIGRRARKEDI